MESKINFTPRKDYVVVEWYVIKKEDEKNKIIIPESSLKDYREDSLNGINEILAVGSSCDPNLKVGQWAMLNHTEVPIVNIDGVSCALYKEHMIVGTFDEKPDLDANKTSKDGPIIRTRKTEEKALKFKDKYKQ
jgi:hypothetical protein